MPPQAPVATRVVVRPLATPLPLGFLALAMSTVAFSALQLEWIPMSQWHVAGLTAVAATVPLQLLASVYGFLTRDPVAATGMGVLAGTWAVAGLTTLTTPEGQSSPGLGVVFLTGGVAMLVPALAAAPIKIAPAAVMGTAALRFAVTGIYELTGSDAWKAAAGWIGLLLALVALYAALALELEGVHERTALPVGRRGSARSAMAGEGSFDPVDLATEAGVRPQL